MVFNLTKFKTLELNGPGLFGSRRSITLFDAFSAFRWKGDHSPEFALFLVILNIRLFEIHFYDNRHEDQYA